MAAVPPPPAFGAPAAPLMPAPHTASFSSLFADPARDPHHGDYTQLLTPFDIDVNNTGSAMRPENVRALVATAGSRRMPLAAGMLVNGRLRLFFLPFKWEPILGAPVDPSLDGKFIAFDGELIYNQGSLVEIPSDAFNRITNQVLVRTIPALKAALAGDLDPSFMVGPFVAGDADTEAVLVRKIIPIPFKYVGLFMSQLDGVTPRFYFDTILPQIELDGNAQMCLPLTHFFQVTITRRQATDITSDYLNVLPPSPFARNARLLSYSHELIFHHFPQANPTAANTQHNQIAAGLAHLYQQKEDHYQASKQAKEADTQKCVSRWMGPDKCMTLCRLVQVATEAGLPPIWKDFSNAKSEERLSLFQGRIQSKLCRMGEHYLDYEPAASFVKKLTAVDWIMHNTDSLKAGSLCNLFNYTDSDIDELQRQNQAINLVQAGTGSISLVDAQSMFSSKLSLPTSDTSICCVRRAEAIFRVILGAGHPAVIFISEHHRVMKAYEQRFLALPMADGPVTTPLRAVYHLQWLNLRFNSFFKAQEITDVPVLMVGNPRDIINKAELQERWEPQLSAAFLEFNGITDLITRERKIAAAVGAAALLTSTSGSTVQSGVTLSTQPGSSTIMEVKVEKESTRVDNPTFNASLFESYKTSAIKSKTLRDKIKKKEIRVLPPSKIDGLPMCLAYHTEGLCNTKCPRVVDHVPYTTAEYSDLSTWCIECYHS